MFPSINHKLKNYVRGWSYFYCNPLDVRKIINMVYRKRIFCIRDREYKYKLTIEYFNPRSKTTLSPNITLGGGIGTVIHNEYVETSIITLRYKTEKEIIDEMDKVKKIQNIIKIYDNEQNKKLQEYINITLQEIIDIKKIN
jgi:hypothetical protein